MNRFSSHQFGRRAFAHAAPVYSVPAQFPAYPAAPAYYGNGVPVFVEDVAPAVAVPTPVLVGGAALLAALALGVL